jgi:OOP family OmpA-OmpF porin
MGKKSARRRLRDLGDAKPATSDGSPFRGPTETGPIVELQAFILMSLVGLAIIVGLGVLYGINVIQGDLEHRATAALQANAFLDVEVEATGQDVQLTGSVSKEEDLATVPQIVASLDGVRSVHSEIRLVLPPDTGDVTVETDPLLMQWSGGAVTVTGDVSDEPTREAILNALGDAFTSVDDTGLTIEEGIPSERDWLSKVLRIIEIGGTQVPDGELYVAPDQRIISMTAEFESRQEQHDVRDAVEEVVDETAFVFDSRLTVADAPEIVPEQVVELQENLDDLIEGKVVEFELNSDVLTSKGIALLDEILVALEKFPNIPIEISGHADSQGDDATNLALSKRRAQAVLDYLVAHGQDPNRFAVVGYGETRPIADNSTAEGRARNRRIEFKALEE